MDSLVYFAITDGFRILNQANAPSICGHRCGRNIDFMFKMQKVKDYGFVVSSG